MVALKLENDYGGRCVAVGRAAVRWSAARQCIAGLLPRLRPLSPWPPPVVMEVAVFQSSGIRGDGKSQNGKSTNTISQNGKSANRKSTNRKSTNTLS